LNNILQKNSTGHYVYIEASRLRRGRAPDYALLATPRLQRGTYCVRFAYHMYGLGVGKLSIMSQQSDLRSELWTESRNRGVVWQQGEFDYTSAEEFRVLFQGSVGRSPTGDIALDAINILQGRC